MSDLSYPGAGWQGGFRTARGALRSLLGVNRFNPETTPTEGQVTGPTPERGVWICDPVDAQADWSIGPATAGLLQNTPDAIGVTPDGLFLITLRRGGGSGTGGCGGGTFPGWYNGGSPPCFASRQTVFEKYPIAADGEVAQDPTVGGSWDELFASANFKRLIVCNDAGTIAVGVHTAPISELLVIDLATGEKLGDIDMTITNSVISAEPAFLGDHVYWPDLGTDKIYDFDLSDPTTPVKVVFHSPTLTSVMAVRANGVFLYACGATGFTSHTVEPLAEVDTVVGIGTWQSMAYDAAADVICAFRKFDGANIAYVTIDVAGTALTLNTQADDIAAMVGAVMDGTGCMAHQGVAICYSERSALSGANTLDAHQFYIGAPAEVFLLQTLGFIHTGAAFNIGPAVSPKYNDGGMRGVFTFNGNSDARVLVPDITDVDVPLPVCVSPLPADLVALLDHGAHLLGLGDDDHGDGEEGYLLRQIYNGSFKEKFDAVVTSDGATVVMSLEQTGGGDLTLQFSDDVSEFDATPAATIELTAGADTSPTENFIYILQSTGVLTKSTSDWPSAEHNKIGYFLVPSAGFVQTEGVYINQNWNDFLAGPDGEGHLLHISEAIRRSGAQYFSGIAGNGATAGYLTITPGSPDNVDWISTAGLVYQLHKHTVPVVDTTSGDTVLVVNDPVTPYDEVTDLNGLLTDSTGGSMSGKYFNLVFWGVANKGGEYAPLMVNLPAGSYNKQSDAEQDVNGYDSFAVPAAFKHESSTGFLIVRITLRHQAAGGGTWTHISELDLRGMTPAIAAGGSTGVATTEFPDNAFRLFDEGDVTKLLAFEVAGVATGNIRTAAVEDGPMTIPLTAEWDDLTDAGATSLHKHDHGGQDGLTDVADHPGYVLIDGTRAWTGEMDCGGQLLDNAPFLRGYIDGLTTELDADIEHDVQVNPGVCADSLVNNDKLIEVAAAFTKRIDAGWAKGDGDGGMATGSVANNIEYNLIIIEEDSSGDIDMMFDVSVTGGNVPGGWTARRRIGSVRTDGSANIRFYEQFGDRFVLEHEIFDVNDNSGVLDTFETATVSVPANMMGLISVDARADSCTNLGFRLRPTGSSVTTNVKANLLDGAGTTTRSLKWEVNFLVDGSSQFEYTLFAQGAGAAWASIKIYFRGWIDDRGRHA